MVTVDRQLSGYAPVLLAVLCVVALGLSAATLTNASTAMLPDNDQGPSPIIGSGGQQGGEQTQGGGVGAGGAASGSDGYIDFTYCIQLLTSPIAVLGILAGFVAAIGLVTKLFSMAAGVLAGLTLVPPLSVTYFFLTNCSGGSVMGVGGGGTGGIAGGIAASSPLPPWMVMGLVFGVMLVGAVVVLWGATGDENFGTDDAEEEQADDSTDVSEIAAAAGEAADRIDTADAVDNEVYRAWREMTDHLNVANPESSTPYEFAEAAIAAGMAEHDVMDLTKLFDEVRYGNVEPSADREERAVETLRRIEETYGDSDDEATTDQTSENSETGGLNE